MTFDPYKVLGVSATATMAQIKRAYRARVKKLHPDTYTEARLAGMTAQETRQAKEDWEALQEAYNILTSEERRDRWDRTGSRETRTPEEQQEIAENQAIITNLLNSVLTTPFPAHTDLRQKMINILDNELNQVKKTRVAESKKLTILEDVVKRWTTKRSTNYVAAALNNQITLVHNALKGCERMEALNRRVHALLMDHTYDWEDPYARQEKSEATSLLSPSLLIGRHTKGFSEF